VVSVKSTGKNSEEMNVAKLDLSRLAEDLFKDLNDLEIVNNGKRDDD